MNLSPSKTQKKRDSILIFPLSLFSLLAAPALAFVLALVKIDDFDVWWHLKCGEMLLKNGIIPTEEIFSYTAAGSPWVDGYLPAQALLYISWWMAGPAGLCLLGALLVTVAFSLALWISKGGEKGFEAAILIAPLAVFMARGVMLPRPALLTPIFALLALWLLEDHRKNNGRRVWLLVPLTALWANCHPAFLLAPIFAGIYFAGNAIMSFFGGNKTKLNLKILMIIPAQLAATLLNPYGHKIYYSTLSLITHPQLREFILEWRPLFSEPRQIFGTLECYIAVVIFGSAVFLWAWNRNRLEYILTFAFLAISTAGARRNLLLFATVSIPLIAWAIREACEEGVEKSFIETVTGQLGRWLKPVITVGVFALIWLAATDRLYFHFSHFRSTGIGVQDGLFSHGAMDFLRREKIRGRVFHNYSIGGYFLFNLYPQYRVYIDGRIFPYSMELFRQGEKALSTNRSFKSICTKYGVSAVLMPLYPHSTWPLIKHLIKNENWAVVHADGSTVLFMLRGAGNDHIIEKHELNLLADPPTLDKPDGSTTGFFGKVIYPYGRIRWAKLYDLMGLSGLAARSLEPALEYRPAVKNLDAWLGGLMVQAGRPEEGLEHLNKVLNKEPDNITALTGLADYYIVNKDFTMAEGILLDISKRDPGLEKVWITLGEIAYNNNDFMVGAEHFKKALELNEKDFKTWEKLGMAMEFFDPDGAKEAYRNSLEQIKESGESREDALRVLDRLRRYSSED